MNHRHLLPEEIDLLVDGEEGFGVAPLRTHVDECPQCEREVESQRSIVAELERLPHLTPSPLFTYKVMKQVQVFEPWHVAALDSVRRFVPQSRSARVFAAATAALVASSMSLAGVWIALHLDAALFLGDLVLVRARVIATSTISSAGGALFGDGAVSTVHANGTVALGIVASIVLSTIVAAAFGLRALASASRRRRS